MAEFASCSRPEVQSNHGFPCGITDGRIEEPTMQGLHCLQRALEHASPGTPLEDLNDVNARKLRYALNRN